MNAFFARLWNRRLVRFGTWTLVSLITLYALLCTLVNWTGSRRWAQAREMLEREGETLDMNKLLPSPVDDSRNFFAIEPLNGITVMGDGKSSAALKRAALEDTGWKNMNGRPPMPSLRDGPLLGVKADIHEWAAYARASKYVDLPTASENEARDLLSAMDARHPLLRQLAEAAPLRPEASFLPPLRPASPMFTMEIPQYAPLQKLSGALVLRSVAACAAGDNAAACHSALALLRLADAAQRDPLLIGELVAVSIHEMAEEAVWTLMEKRQCTEADLLLLQVSLEKLDFRKAMLLAMRGELAASIDTLEYMRTHVYRTPELLAVSSTDGASDAPSALNRVLSELVPSGLFNHNKAVMARMEFEHYLKPLKLAKAKALMQEQVVLEAEINANRRLFRPDRWIANLIVPALSRVAEGNFAAEATRRQSLTACALERYYLVHHAYPQSLQDLVPAQLASVPADPMDDQPLRYRQTGDGRYRLWSVGFDEKDDGGQVNLKTGAKSPSGMIHKASYQGDWTWQYQPVE